MKFTSPYLLLIGAAVFWSIGGLFIKIVDLHVLAITGVRSLGAAGVLFLYIKKVRWHWRPYFIGGVLAYSSMVILYVFSIRLTTAANAIFLQFTAPVWVIIFGYFILKEKVTLMDVGILSIMFSGMGLFFLDELSLSGLWGNLMALCAGICLALVTVTIRREKESAFEIVFFGNALTAMICIPWILSGFEGTIKFHWIMILFLGVFQLGIPYIMYTKALKHVHAIDAILVGMIEPILNPIWVYLFIGESMGDWAFIGAVLVLGGSLGRSYYKYKSS